jgi:2-keto-3-deoxy-L-rhamnonate aldolase RhmA
MKDIWAAMESGEVVIGHWVASASPVVVETVGYSGLDMVAIDCEHGPISPYGGELDSCIRAAYASDVAPVVRVSSHDGAQISRAADLGALGVIVPHVNTAAQLQHLFSHAQFPPVGNRGCYPSVRASRFGATPWHEYAERTLNSFTVVPLLEEPEAFENLDALLDVDGLRAVAIGPLDLAARLNGVGAPESEAQVEQHLAELIAACSARGISVIDGAWNVDSVRHKVQAGIRGILYSIDVNILGAALRDGVGGIRESLADVST